MQNKGRVASYPRYFRIIQQFLNHFGLAIVKIGKNDLKSDEINLNIGSGDSYLPGFINLDMPSTWYSQVQARNRFIPFNAFTDNLPFNDKSVSNIYISHVIEHLPEDIVKRLIIDSLRCLKSEGVLRLCFPDAEFLYTVTKRAPQFWSRKETNFFGSVAKTVLAQHDEFDYLSQELASWSRFQSDPLRLNALEAHLQMKRSDFEETMNIAHSESQYSSEQPGRHISWWTYSKLESLRFEDSFPGTQIVQSKYQGSVSRSMTGYHFDKTVAFLSAYVEYIKA